MADGSYGDMARMLQGYGHERGLHGNDLVVRPDMARPTCYFGSRLSRGIGTRINETYGVSHPRRPTQPASPWKMQVGIVTFFLYFFHALGVTTFGLYGPSRKSRVMVAANAKRQHRRKDSRVHAARMVGKSRHRVAIIRKKDAVTRKKRRKRLK